MLLVSQPNAVGLPSLANVDIEIDQIKSHVPAEYVLHRQSDQGASVGEILNDLDSTQMLHLACHGHQDQNNPLNSGFDLQDGRLTLGQLMHLNTPDAQFAYLSACDSAGMDESRPDEGLNLVGTMIFVGFKSVVGTMW
jgi:CHAT domain-containing protein